MLCGFLSSMRVTTPVTVTGFCWSCIAIEWCADAGADGTTNRVKKRNTTHSCSSHGLHEGSIRTTVGRIVGTLTTAQPKSLLSAEICCNLVIQVDDRMDGWCLRAGPPRSTSNAMKSSENYSFRLIVTNHVCQTPPAADASIHGFPAPNRAFRTPLMWVQPRQVDMGLSHDSVLSHAGAGSRRGLSAGIDLCLLGFAPKVPSASLRQLYPVVWLAFAISAVSGTILLLADASTCW
jgi:hypothetical protein